MRGEVSLVIHLYPQLKARFQGLQFTLIEDLHDLPFIDAQLHPFTVNASDWSSAVSLADQYCIYVANISNIKQLAADVFFNIAASTFNFRNSHWEPVIEPWGFGIKVAQDPATKTMNLGVESKECLNIDVTHSFLETWFTVSGSMFEEQVSTVVILVYTANMLSLLAIIRRWSKASSTIFDT